MVQSRRLSWWIAMGYALCWAVFLLLAGGSFVRIPAALISALWLWPARHHLSFGAWTALSVVGGIFAATVGQGFALLLLDPLSFSTRASSIGYPILREIAFGLTFGAIQGYALRGLCSDAYPFWVGANVVAWSAYGAIGAVGTYLYVSGTVDAIETIGAFILLAAPVPGIILGLALKRVIEVHPPADGAIEETPEVPSGVASV